MSTKRNKHHSLRGKKLNCQKKEKNSFYHFTYKHMPSFQEIVIKLSVN